MGTCTIPNGIADAWLPVALRGWLRRGNDAWCPGYMRLWLAVRSVTAWAAVMWAGTIRAMRTVMAGAAAGARGRGQELGFKLGGQLIQYGLQLSSFAFVQAAENVVFTCVRPDSAA